MTTDLIDMDEKVYTLTDGLRDRTLRATVRYSEPNESTREDVLIQKLGGRGWGRVFQFRHYYVPEWGDGRTKALSPRALDAFFRFLEKAVFPEGCTPSVFLTDRGGIELCWEDVNGQAVQVEFTSEFSEYFRAAKEDEGTLPLRDLTALIECLFA